MGLPLCPNSCKEKEVQKVVRISSPIIPQHDELNIDNSKNKVSMRLCKEKVFKDGQEDEKLKANSPSDISIKKENSSSVVTISYEDCIPENLQKYPTSNCNRCKREFAQIGDKSFKMCEHCRVLQRQRSRRWQRRTKQKEGVCTRCGTYLSEDSTKYSLCQHCRDMLRTKKANRYLQGKCVHCSGPKDEEGNYKVCKRCREKDKLRRLTLEQEGLCNRCSLNLSRDERGHKICQACRTKKRKNGLVLGNDTPLNEGSVVRNIEVEQLFAGQIPSTAEIESSLQSRLIKPKSIARKRKTDHHTKNCISKNIQVPSENYMPDEKFRDTDGSRNHLQAVVNEIENYDATIVSNTSDEKNDEKCEMAFKIIGKKCVEPTVDEDKINSSVCGKALANCSPDTSFIDGKCRLQPTIPSDGPSKARKTFKTKGKTSCVVEADESLVTGCDESESNDNGNLQSLHENVEKYQQHIMNADKSLHENMILSQTFNIPHDHSQLNRQLKQLSQYTSHSSNANGGIEDEDDESVLVDLEGLEAIGMEYNLEDVDNENSTTGEGNVEYDEEKETMLRHVRAVQAGLLSNTAEPSDAEIAAAVEAVAVAAAVAQSRTGEK